MQMNRKQKILFGSICIITLILLIIPFISFASVFSDTNKDVVALAYRFDNAFNTNSRFLFFCWGGAFFIISNGLLFNEKLKNLDLRGNLRAFYYGHKYLLQSYCTAFVIVLIIYGAKLCFQTYLSDDYALMNSQYGVSSIGWLGRWFLPFFNSVFYSGWSSINPYFNTLVSLLAITLASLFSAIIWKINDRFLMTLIIVFNSVSMYFAGNLAYNLNTSVHISFLLVPLSILLFQKNKRLFPVSIIVLALAIGIYQTTLQIALMILLVWFVILLVQQQSKKQIWSHCKELLLLVSIVVGAYLLSNIACNLILNFYNIIPVERYAASRETGILQIIKNALHFFDFIPYFGLSFINFQSQLLFFSIALIGTIVFVLEAKKQGELGIKVVLLVLIVIISCYVIKLQILYDLDLSSRALVHFSWFISMFIIVGYNARIKLLQSFTIIATLTLIIYSSAAISSYYNNMAKVTQLDIIKANSIVNSIRQNDNYNFSKNDTVCFYIIGEQNFDIGEKSVTDAFKFSWSKYRIFKHATDFKFVMPSPKQKELIEQQILSVDVEDYPSKKSILIIDNMVVLVLDKDQIVSD